DLDHLDYAGRQLVALGQLGQLLAVDGLDLVEILLEAAAERLDQLGVLGGGQRELRPVLARDLLDGVLGEHHAAVDQYGALIVDQLGGGGLADQDLLDPIVVAGRDDRDVVAVVLAQLVALGVLDLLGADVLVDALSREHPGVDDDARHARRQPQRGVAHVAGLLAEDGAQQLLLGRQLGLALGRDLADQDVAGVDLGADPDDPRLVEVLERFLADVGDVAGDLFLAELGVTGDALEFLDVDRRVHVLADQPLRDQDRVLEVVALPGHERDQQVLAERELAPLGRSAVGDDVAALDPIADVDDRLLVERGVLVGAPELDQVVDIGLGPEDAAVFLAAVGDRLDHDAAAVDLLDHAVADRDHRRARVAGDGGLHPGPDQRPVGPQARARLPLHVR